MANPHVKKARVTVNCTNPDCTNTFERLPSQLAKRKRHFCSPQCKKKTIVSYKYDDAALEYVREHLKADGYEAVSSHLNITVHALRKQLTEWRKKGVEVPYTKWVADGHVRIYTTKGVTYRQRKEGKKWITLERLTPKAPKAPRKPKANPNKLVPKPKRWPESKSTYGKPPKKELPKHKTRVVAFDATIHTMVKVDSKTWKQVLKTA